MAWLFLFAGIRPISFFNFLCGFGKIDFVLEKFTLNFINEHRVIDTGPYAYVRHPGYVGFVGWIISTPLLLAWAWACMPALISVLLLVIRTALEDRTLRYELSGYEEYANRVCFRLIPGVW